MRVLLVERLFSLSRVNVLFGRGSLVLVMKARRLCCGFVSALCVEREVAVDGSSWCLFFFLKISTVAEKREAQGFRFCMQRLRVV